MKVLIVEDEIIIAAELAQILQEMDFEVSGLAVNYTNAVSILKEETPDIAIVDIHLGGSNSGVDLGNYINENNKIPFIYLTSNDDRLTLDQALATKPNAYLLKPFDKTAIYSALHLALQNKNKLPTESNQLVDLIIDNALFVKEKDLHIKVAFEEILYFKSDKNYIEVITKSKNYLIRSTFQKLIEQLPKNIFVKVHKSFAVNAKKISAINHEFLYIEDFHIPISPNHRETLLNMLKTFS